MAESLIRTTITDGVLTVTINRSEKANSLTPDMLIQLRDLFGGVVKDHTVRTVIITGAGDRVFCGGADLNTLHDDQPGSDLWLDMTQALRNVSVPTVSAINGPCIGGGLTLALACDMRFSVPEARFFYPVLKNNILPGQYDVDRLHSLIGPGRTSMLLLSGVEVSSEEALSWGLVDRLVNRESLIESCHAFSEVPSISDSEHLKAIKSMLAASLS